MNEAKVLQGWVSSVSTLLLSGNKKLPHERSVTRRHRKKTTAPDGMVGEATRPRGEGFRFRKTTNYGEKTVEAKSFCKK